MYRAIVARIYRRTWAAMNRHDPSGVLDMLAPTFEQTFFGDTSLSGTRTERATLDRWFERLFRLLPDARFELQRVAVTGWPWRTCVFGAFTIEATVAGEPYRNVFVQQVDLRWGKIVAYRVLEDTQAWAAAEARLAAAGDREVTAPRIADRATALDWTG